MTERRYYWVSATVIATMLLGACVNQSAAPRPKEQKPARVEKRETIWDLFDQKADSNTQVAVNKYIWKASLEVLDFLPLEVVDPFTGVISTKYGKPPGGGTAYRATVYVQDPALDARSLRVVMQTSSGAVDAKTIEAIELAILTRARELRRADLSL